jgi:hypothetical protein
MSDYLKEKKELYRTNCIPQNSYIYIKLSVEAKTNLIYIFFQVIFVIVSFISLHIDQEINFNFPAKCTYIPIC